MKQASHLALASIALALPALSMAAGQITFKGKVIDQTCSVKVEGTESPTVDLPTVSTGQLAASGKTAGLKPFTVEVSGCNAGTAEMKINTVFSGAIITSDGNLPNVAAETDAAKHVEIQLLSDASGSDDSIIQLASVTSVPGLVLKPNETSASQQFAARYYATGAATVGDVKAVVNYDITYE